MFNNILTQKNDTFFECRIIPTKNLIKIYLREIYKFIIYLNKNIESGF